MQDKEKKKIDLETIKGFGQEWTYFDQSSLLPEEREQIFNKYFSIFPWELVSKDSEGFDLGCGTGRWALCMAPKVGKLHCIDPSSAIEVARKNLSQVDNCIFHKEGVNSMPLSNESMDFGYSLGVLHHISNTQEGINECVKKLKPGAPLLLYLYYRLENKPFLYRTLWLLSNPFRSFISRLPYFLRYIFTQMIAAFIYWPLAKLAYLLVILSVNPGLIPLAEYRDKSFYTMRTDAFDRFATRLENRFSLDEIKSMMTQSCLERIVYRDSPPFWCVLGYKERK